MKVGIGIPNPVAAYKLFPGTGIVDWAVRAEERGFTGLATIDRIAYANYDSFATLAAAAGATSRIELLSNIALGPAYPTVLLAKTAATIDQVSGGRFTLGLAPGSREDDYTAVGHDFQTRGKAFDIQLDELHAAWRGEPLTDGGAPVAPVPTANDRVPLLVGGHSPASFRRAVQWAEGFTIGGAGPEQAAQIVEQARAAWREAGREGEPRIAALAYFALGAETADDSRGYLRHYYGWLGEYAGMIADGALRTEDAVAAARTTFAEAGITELYFDPTTPGLEQVDRLADVVR